MATHEICYIPTAARDRLAEARIPNRKVCVRRQEFQRPRFYVRMRVQHSPDHISSLSS
jgi:hypothetical protein